MSVARKLLGVLALGLVLAACGDGPAGPCARGFACQVAGVDLFVERLEIVAAERDPETGLGIIDPSPVEIEFSVANRGDTTSGPTILVLRYGSNPGYPGSPGALAPDDSVQIPPLRPGERYEQRVAIELDEWGAKSAAGRAGRDGYYARDGDAARPGCGHEQQPCALTGGARQDRRAGGGADGRSGRSARGASTRRTCC